MTFTSAQAKGTLARFDDFLAWASPFGSGSINDVHAPGYMQDDPFFTYHRRFLPRGHLALRSFLYRHEGLGRKRTHRARRGSDLPPEILDPLAFIESGPYLRFAKACINIFISLKALKSFSKTLVFALIFLERANRDANGGDNHPLLLSHLVFSNAQALLAASSLHPTTQYDTGKDLELLAGMLQGGYHSKTFNHAGLGFGLISGPFVFKSNLKARPRKRAIRNSIEPSDAVLSRMTNEEMAATGLAFRKSTVKFGIRSVLAFIASAICLTFTTTSMRIGELFLLRRDSIYRSTPRGRLRIRIGRPKIGVHQDLLVPARLEALSEEFFECALGNSLEAHKAFKFYIEKFGEDFSSIDEIYIPDRMRPLLESEFLTFEQAWAAVGLDPEFQGIFPPCAKGVPNYKFIDEPGDIFKSCETQRILFVKAGEVRAACAAKGLAIDLPDTVADGQYVSRKFARMLLRDLGGQSRLDSIFEEGKTAKIYIRTADFKLELLKDFKAKQFPHWPYSTKDHYTRLDQALMVWFAPNMDGQRAGIQVPLWWLPMPIVDTTLNNWISQSPRGGPPHLYRLLDIKLKNGKYPSITVHKVRKYHQTEALIAGANIVFADQRAGRETGPQGDTYDLRTPDEIARGSIDTFDPDAQFEVRGPLSELDSLSTIPLVDRRAFLYEVAAPKHTHELGGCRSDWSLNPCEFFGNCTSCGQHTWMKGDTKRLPNIVAMRDDAFRSIEVGTKKLVANPGRVSILKQIKQFRDTLARCDEILAAETDLTIPIGTIITFKQAEGTMTQAQRTDYLRAAHIAGV